MGSVQYDAPDKVENVTVVSVRALGTGREPRNGTGAFVIVASNTPATAEEKTVVVVVAREGMKTTLKSGGSVTLDPVWEKGQGGNIGYVTYRNWFGEQLLVDPHGSVDFGFTATVALEVYGDCTDPNGPNTKKLTQAVTFAAGERARAVLFEKVKINPRDPAMMVARVRDARLASGAPGVIRSGIGGYLDGGWNGTYADEAEKDVTALMDKFGLNRPAIAQMPNSNYGDDPKGVPVVRDDAIQDRQIGRYCFV
jgi:hypothetical protein